MCRFAVCAFVGVCECGKKEMSHFFLGREKDTVSLGNNFLGKNFLRGTFPGTNFLGAVSRGQFSGR